MGPAGPRAGLVHRVGHDPRRLQPAVSQVVRRRQAERLSQLPRPPRRGRDRRSRRVSLARRGGRGARHHVRAAAGRHATLRQRAESARDRRRRRGRHLPADDPAGRRRDARLRTDRCPAQRRLRRLQRRGGQGAHGVQRGQGAGHGRRGPAQGQDGPDQGPGRRRDGRPADARDDLRRQAHGRRLPDARRARRVVRRGPGRGRPGMPGRAAGCRAPAVHPLLVRLDGQAEGHPAHDRRLPDPGRVDAQARVRPQAGVRRLLLLGRRRLDHRPQLHRLRAVGQRRDVGHVRGRAGLPRQGRLVGPVRALRGDDLLHGADRDPVVHQVGRRVPGPPRPEQAAAARHGRRADQPQGVALVPQGHRRRALPDRRHVVADGDRRDHDHDAARRAVRQARLGRDGRCPGSRPRC